MAGTGSLEERSGVRYELYCCHWQELVASKKGQGYGMNSTAATSARLVCESDFKHEEHISK
jgi:hypothetical protein